MNSGSYYADERGDTVEYCYHVTIKFSYWIRLLSIRIPICWIKSTCLDDVLKVMEPVLDITFIDTTIKFSYEVRTLSFDLQTVEFELSWIQIQICWIRFRYR